MVYGTAVVAVVEQDLVLALTDLVDMVVVVMVQVVDLVLLELLIVVVAAAVFQTLTVAAVVLVELDLFLSDTQHKYLKNRNVFYKGRI
jgi:hypothetical protein